LIQANFTAEKVVEQFKRLIPDSPARTEMISDLEEVQSKLRQVAVTTGAPAIARAAQRVMEVVSSEAYVEN